MKKLIFLLLLGLPALAQREAEQAQIKQALQTESSRFYARDFKRWADAYDHGAKIYWSCIEPGVTLEANGWPALAKLVGDYMKANPKPARVDVRRQGYKFQFYGNAAWVTFDEFQTENGSTKALRGTRILEKGPAGWKIVYLNSYPVPAGAVATAGR